MKKLLLLLSILLLASVIVEGYSYNTYRPTRYASMSPYIYQPLQRNMISYQDPYVYTTPYHYRTYTTVRYSPYYTSYPSYPTTRFYHRW